MLTLLQTCHIKIFRLLQIYAIGRDGTMRGVVAIFEEFKRRGLNISIKMDKSALLNDAIRVVAELRSEAQKVKDSNESLQVKIKELKVCPVSYS